MDCFLKKKKPTSLQARDDVIPNPYQRRWNAIVIKINIQYPSSASRALDVNTVHVVAGPPAGTFRFILKRSQSLTIIVRFSTQKAIGSKALYLAGKIETALVTAGPSVSNELGAAAANSCTAPESTCIKTS
ncbi:hypothetical protein EVAR_95271_1 [Eumeta japonica]|uniref:Uncharacterized protein n=1 Tax=Eumeta variegata TaxID=151549 RepID=A0A4C1UKA9_EUMVA|nr:hypothetical protein EVAR_95271_1 [Eumeta japonica]